MTQLVLVRHGESTWNAKGLWTGWQDPPLSKKGFEQSRESAEKLRGIKFDIAYTSTLARAQQTLDEIIRILGINIPVVKSDALNERDYGDYTGKNKWDVEKQLSPDGFKKLRRGWDDPVPNGETLKDVYNRVVPFYEKEILPKLKAEKNVLISAHGNSLRALVKYLNQMTDEEIENFEVATGEIIVYNIDEYGKVVSKEARHWA